MHVYLLKDIEKVGFAGQIVKVSDGYAANFLFPKKLAVPASKAEEQLSQQKAHKAHVNAEILNSKTSMLAEKIKNTNLVLKERVHDKNKLYGSVSSDEIVALLKEKDIVITKKQVEFEKSIKTVGEYKVTIKLSSKLQPQLTLKVVAE